MEFSRKRYLILFGLTFLICSFFYFLEVPNSTTEIPQYYSFPNSISRSASRIIFESQRRTNSTNSSFIKTMLNFNWEGYAEVIEKSNGRAHYKSNVEAVEAYHENLMLRLTPFLKMEPLVPINASCSAPPLPLPSDLKCENHGNALQGSLRSSIPKIGMLIQFGFDVDILEIHLNEIYDLVDQFFIIESSKSHFRTIQKPLMWEHVKSQPRFLKFADKITHFVVDDADVAEVKHFFQSSTSLFYDLRIWKMEKLQEALRWNKFLRWNKAHKFFQHYDLIGFGDADEIPSRQTLHMMKYCELKGDRVDIGIWFPFGNISQAFATDFPVPKQPHTLGDPTFWTLRSATEYGKNKKKAPTRQRGATGNFLLGGIHMSRYGYLPFRLVKDLSCTECSPYSSAQISNLVKRLEKNEIRKLEVEYNAIPSSILNRVVPLETIAEEMKEIAILPWFYACNRKRYPVWEGGHDTRLD